MPSYTAKIKVTTVEYYEIDIEADSQEDAWEKADDVSISDCTRVDDDDDETREVTDVEPADGGQR